MPDDARRIVIGIGNPGRGDDGAGHLVVKLLQGALPDGTELVEHDGEPASLLSKIDGISAAFLVDACASGAPEGTVHRFDVAAAPLPQGAFGLSTHGLGLAEAVELARALGQLPSQCIVYAIEGRSFEVGAPLSPRVAAAAADVAQRLRAEVTG
jgi:hydrogenase maturation protease